MKREVQNRNAGAHARTPLEPFILDYAKDHDEFRSADIARERGVHNREWIVAAIKRLMNAGHVVKIGHGRYALTGDRT